MQLRHFDIPPRGGVPDRKCVSMWMDAFQPTGNVFKERKGPLKTVQTPENLEQVRVSIHTDHFAKAATANGVEVRVSAPRSCVIKTLQNELIEDWESRWSNSNTGLRVKNPSLPNPV
ncbi:hypothetical protein TNCV_2886041 [Trichonephila clavipes]|nr:hypothetical protein TNCV_2886041 [Trichonephila clavipes]